MCAISMPSRSIASASSSAPGRPMTPTAIFSVSRCSKLTMCRRITRPSPGHRAYRGPLHLPERADVDLPHALAQHAEFGGEVFQRHRSCRHAPRLENAACPGVEHARGAIKRLATMIELLALGHDGFLVG